MKSIVATQMLCGEALLAAALTFEFKRVAYYPEVKKSAGVKSPIQGDMWKQRHIIDLPTPDLT